MLFRLVYDDHLAQAAYLIGCQVTGEAILVDPERDVDRYLALADREGLRVTAVTETHIHADYLSGARELAERLDVRLYLSDEGGDDWRYRWPHEPRTRGGAYDVTWLHDGDTFPVGNIRFRVMHVPGHTPEHVVFLVSDLGAGAREPMGVLTGDFVFVGSLGRPDLLEAAAGIAHTTEPAARALARSSTRFLELPDYLQLWPAHGAGSACGKALGAVPQSTLGYERRYNAGLSLATDEDAFVRFILEGQPDPPRYFGRMKVQNRDGVPLLGALPSPRAMAADTLVGAGATGSVDASRTVLLDTRPWDAFCERHVPGAIHAPWESAFYAIAGSYAEPADEIVLIVDEDDLADAVRVLVRIGLDRVVGYVTPSDLDALGEGLETFEEVDADEFEARATGGAFVLDVRNPDEFASRSLPGAARIGYTRLLDHLAELPRDRQILVHCQSGHRSAAAVSFLVKHGFDAVHLAGGLDAWVAARKSTRSAPDVGGSDTAATV